MYVVAFGNKKIGVQFRVRGPDRDGNSYCSFYNDFNWDRNGILNNDLKDDRSSDGLILESAEILEAAEKRKVLHSMNVHHTSHRGYEERREGSWYSARERGHCWTTYR